MPKQEKRDKIICALYKMWNDFDSEIHEPTGSPPEDVLEGYKATIYEVVEMLKEQNPHVMTIKELRGYYGPVWTEWRDRERAFIGNGWEVLRLSKKYATNGKTNYGIKYRYWTSKPTAEDMESTPWAQTNG